MAGAAPIAATAPPVGRLTRWSGRAGQVLYRHRRVIGTVQWALVAVYAVLLVVPAFLPLPAHTRHIWNDLTLFAQFLFWGLWWPFVLLSVVLMGRLWCGVFCPEGTLTEFASRHGRGGTIPRWVRWGGWPFVAFAATTVYGQMISVYQYPKAALLVLGGSTLAAVAVGYLYGRDKRIWCRYLCPVSGVFGVLAKLSPLHYHTDKPAWAANRARERKAPPVNCPTLLPLHQLDGASLCQACGRCSGHREAIALRPRSPNAEIIHADPAQATAWEFLLIVFGLGGLAVGAFHWTASPWLVALKQWLARWLIEHDRLWLLERSTPWWVFTNYPAQNDVFNLLDGLVLLAYIGATALVLGGAQSLLLMAANRVLGRDERPRLYHLSYAMIPLAGCGVFLGLTTLTVSMLRAERITISWADPVRAGLLAGAGLWSAWLMGRLCRRYAGGVRAVIAWLLGSGCVVLGLAAWYLLFWGWAG